MGCIRLGSPKGGFQPDVSRDDSASLLKLARLAGRFLLMAGNKHLHVYACWALSFLWPPPKQRRRNFVSEAIGLWLRS